MNSLLGLKMTDKITGFSGVVTGYVSYLTGCDQCLLTPSISPDGAIRSAEWFDEQRLTVDGDAARIVLDNGRSPGCDKAAPKR